MPDSRGMQGLLHERTHAVRRWPGAGIRRESRAFVSRTWRAPVPVLALVGRAIGSTASLLCLCCRTQVRPSWSTSTDRLDALVETQARHCGKTQGREEEKRQEEIRLLP